MQEGERLKISLQQAKTAGLALILGREAGLKNRTLEFFVNFIAQRFPDERDETYIFNWAIRLLAGNIWSMSNNKSRTTLLRIAKEMKLENIPGEWSKDI